MPPCIALRADASTRSGTGHVVRCLSLATELRDTGVRTVLVSRRLGIDVSALAQRAGVEFCELRAPIDTYLRDADDPAHADWAELPALIDAEETAATLISYSPRCVIVDHYAFDARWHRSVAAALGARIVAIDDLADRSIEADILIDHNLADDHAAKYRETNSNLGRVLGGPRFALLGPSYRFAKRYAFRDEVLSVGIFMGGSDPWNASLLVLDVLRKQCNFKGLIEIATTTANSHLADLQARCSFDGAARLLVNEPSLHDFYSKHDIQIGAGGVASWERCCIGAPMLILKLAVNQHKVADALRTAGVARVVSRIEPDAIGHEFTNLCLDPVARRKMSELGPNLVDGLGARRTAIAIRSHCLSMRLATMDDAAPSLVWRNDPNTRRFFRDPAEIRLADHLHWWGSTLSNPQYCLMIAEVGRKAVGIVRLDYNKLDAEISIYVDPTLTGLGLGPRMLNAVVTWVKTTRVGLTSLFADIDTCNRASEAAFSAAGFIRIAPTRWSKVLDS